MKKKVFGRRLQRDTKERKALFKSLTREFLLRESIKTTEAKAKAVRGEIEKLITKAKKNAFETKRILSGVFEDRVLTKLVDDIAPRFVTRPGGYTRIVRLGRRVQDNAQMVMFSLVVGSEKKALNSAVEEKEVKKPTNKKTTIVRKTVKQSEAKTSLSAPKLTAGKQKKSK